MQQRVLMIALAVAAALAHGVCDAASLKVSPGRFMVQGITPGTEHDIYKEAGLRIAIYNDDDVARTWVLSTHKPSERGRWEKGYGEIPDPGWCWFSEEEVTVEPDSVGYANVFIHVPDEAKYFNQHWVVTLSIGSKPGTAIVGLAVDVRMQIETQSKADVDAPPDGALAMSPSLVDFDEVAPGNVREASVTLYNNDTVDHEYAVGSLFADDTIKYGSYLSGTYSKIPDPAWLTADETVRIPAGGSAPVHLQLAVPADVYQPGSKWEDIVLVQPDDGSPEFVRVRIETSQEAQEQE